MELNLKCLCPKYLSCPKQVHIHIEKYITVMIKHVSCKTTHKLRIIVESDIIYTQIMENDIQKKY
jgi:hypothetical protein